MTEKKEPEFHTVKGTPKGDETTLTPGDTKEDNKPVEAERPNSSVRFNDRDWDLSNEDERAEYIATRNRLDVPVSPYPGEVGPTSINPATFVAVPADDPNAFADPGLQRGSLEEDYPEWRVWVTDDNRNVWHAVHTVTGAYVQIGSEDDLRTTLNDYGKDNS